MANHDEHEKFDPDILQTKGLKNRRLRCRLDEIMRERGITGKRLAEVADVGTEAITLLRRNNFKAVTSKVIVNICDALCVDIGELFELVPDDIWFPIRSSKEVTFHFGSRLFAETPPGFANGEDSRFYRPHIGLADFRAFMRIQAHLTRMQPNVRVRFEEHATDASSAEAAQPDYASRVQRVFAAGNHVFLGSPIALGMVEEVVCKAYGVPPYTFAQREAFPYGFAWDAWRQVRSSLGWQGHGSQCGIAALPSNKIVAPCTQVRHGIGTDGGLIVVLRLFDPPAFNDGGDGERVIICLLGFGGSGTEAAAQIALDPSLAAELYPPTRNKPRMRAVACKYYRDETPELSDKQLREVELVAETKPRRSRLRAVEGRRR